MIGMVEIFEGEDGRGKGGELDVRGSVDWGVCAAHFGGCGLWFGVGFGGIDEFCVGSVSVK